MLSPIVRVLGTVAGFVIFQDITGMGGKEFTDLYPVPTMLPKNEFNKRLRYETMPDKTWCDVCPNRYPPDERDI